MSQLGSRHLTAAILIGTAGAVLLLVGQNARQALSVQVKPADVHISGASSSVHPAVMHQWTPAAPSAALQPQAPVVPGAQRPLTSATMLPDGAPLAGPFRWLALLLPLGAIAYVIQKVAGRSSAPQAQPLLGGEAPAYIAMAASSGEKEPGEVDISIFRPVGTLIPGEKREGNLSRRFTEPFDDDRLSSVVGLGWRKFKRELLAIGKSSLPIGPGEEPSRPLIDLIRQLKLDQEGIMKREEARAPIPTTPPVQFIYNLVCKLLDVVFEGRPIPRFWVLETVARMPYFAYMTTLHLYETFGWWRSTELRNIHQAEEDNEAHHLMIMEALGGDMRWFDRFVAEHAAIIYYWVLVAFYFVDPRFSYNFSRMLESHAVDTYGQFVDENAEVLRNIPSPPVATDYYNTGELYYFDKFHSTQRNKPKEEWRRPPCATLYDVFSNIRDDELEHVNTMKACEMWVSGEKPPFSLGPTYDLGKYDKVMETPEGRQAWKEWSKEFNSRVTK